MKINLTTLIQTYLSMSALEAFLNIKYTNKKIIVCFKIAYVV